MKTRNLAVVVMTAVSLSAGADTRYWTGAAEDGKFFNPTNWSTRTSKLAWADTLYFTNSAPIVVSTKKFGADDPQWPRYVYLQGSDVIVKDGIFRLHGKGASPLAFFDIAEGAKFVITNSTEHTSGGYMYLNNYNGGEIVKKGKGSIEVWGRGATSGNEMSRVEGNLLHVMEGEVSIRTTSSCGCYLVSSEVVVDEGAVLSLAGGYNSGNDSASWTINGTLRLYTGGGQTACGALNGTGVITNTPWYSLMNTLTVCGGENLESAFAGTVPSDKVRIGLNKATAASDGYFKVVSAEQYRNSGGIYFKGKGRPLSFAAGIGSFNLGTLAYDSDSVTAVLALDDAAGEPIELTASISGADLGRLNTEGKGDLFLDNTGNATVKGSKIAHEGVFSVSRNLNLGDGTDAANDFDFANGPRRIEMRSGGTVTVDNVNPFSYAGTLASLGDGNLNVMGDGTIARVERNGGQIRNYGDLIINGGFMRSTYSFYIDENKTLTLSGVEVGYSASNGVNFNSAAGNRLVFNGRVMDVSAYDKYAPMRFEQRGGEVRFIGGHTYTPPTVASDLDPATYLFDGGITRFYSGTPFNSTAINLLAGTAGAKIRGSESAIASTANIYIKSPFKSGTVAPATDGGVEIDARSWFRLLYPLEITGPFKLQGSGC